MSAIFFLIIASLVVAVIFLGAFIWSVRTGQFDDHYTPSIRMLFEDGKNEPPNPTEEESNQS
jgi:cbb3-type cytochrome oxidase maturation protein